MMRILIALLVSSFSFAGPIAEHLDHCYYTMQKRVANVQATITELESESTQLAKKQNNIKNEVVELNTKLKKRFPTVEFGKSDTYTSESMAFIDQIHVLVKESLQISRSNSNIYRQIESLQDELPSIKSATDFYYRAPRTRKETEEFLQQKRERLDKLHSSIDVKKRKNQDLECKELMNKISKVFQSSYQKNEEFMYQLPMKCGQYYSSVAYYAHLIDKNNSEVTDHTTKFNELRNKLDRLYYSRMPDELIKSTPSNFAEEEITFRFQAMQTALNVNTSEPKPLKEGDPKRDEAERMFKQFYELEQQALPLMNAEYEYVQEERALEKEITYLEKLLTIQGKTATHLIEQNKCFEYRDYDYAGFITSITTIDEIMKAKTQAAFSTPDCNDKPVATTQSASTTRANPDDDQVGPYKVSRKEYEERKRQERREREMQQRWTPGWEKK